MDRLAKRNQRLNSISYFFQLSLSKFLIFMKDLIKINDSGTSQLVFYTRLLHDNAFLINE
jgi:hypothetical protein